MTTSGGPAGEYHVALPAFEGPLDLLLHLIQKHELDIMDIPVAFITEKYLEYLALMKEMSIDVASEYLVMAATLAHIKSKSLLPAPPPNQEDEIDGDELDPRAELVRRLLEYQKYKQAAADLGERGLLGRDVFLRGVAAPESEGPAPLAPATIFSLMDAFARVLARTKVVVEHEVSFDRMSIAERIQELGARLAGCAGIRFEELLGEGRHRSDLVLTFLALLEMTRLKMTRFYQVDPLSDIYIELAAADSVGGGPDVAGEGDPPPDQGPGGQEQT
jgi:segregation and condensation protein A